MSSKPATLSVSTDSHDPRRHGRIAVGRDGGRRRRSPAIVALATLSVVIPATMTSTARASLPARFPYALVDLGTLGGPNDFQNYPGRSLTENGTAIGEADTTQADPRAPFCFEDCTISPAVEWRRGRLTDLGALPGPNSACATWIDERGTVVGVSQYGDAVTGGLDHAVLWQNGKIRDLGTLGGNQSAAGSVNDEGQVAGAALNTVADPIPNSAGIVATTNCDVFPVNTQEVRPFLWQHGVMHDLGTLGGPDAAASWINDSGQVAGQSFTDSVVNAATGYPTMDPFLWQRGKMIDLGTLGGTSGTATWLTGRGEVVGTSNLSGDQTHHAFTWKHGTLTDLGTLGGANSEAFWANDRGSVVGRADFFTSPYHHAVLWRDGTTTDLGTVDGDPSTTAVSVNDHDQIVGDGSGGHGWLWENGTMRDLNSLIAPGNALSVEAAANINDNGEIYGTATLANGNQHIVLLVPSRR